MTPETLSREEARWERQKTLILREQKLKEEKKAIHRLYFPKITTTKLLMAFLFINCTVIEVFSMYVTLQEFHLAREMLGAYTPDLTPLVTLISTVVGEVIAFAVYAVKSLKENTVGGVVYETAMREQVKG